MKRAHMLMLGTDKYKDGLLSMMIGSSPRLPFLRM